MESACDIFYGIYNDRGQSDIINDLLRRLDFHTLSIKLLATTVPHNMWDYNRLVREWDAYRTHGLRTGYNELGGIHRTFSRFTDALQTWPRYPRPLGCHRLLPPRDQREQP